MTTETILNPDTGHTGELPAQTIIDTLGALVSAASHVLHKTGRVSDGLTELLKYHMPEECGFTVLREHRAVVYYEEGVLIPRIVYSSIVDGSPQAVAYPVSSMGSSRWEIHPLKNITPDGVEMFDHITYYVNEDDPNSRILWDTLRFHSVMGFGTAHETYIVVDNGVLRNVVLATDQSPE